MKLFFEIWDKHWQENYHESNAFEKWKISSSKSKRKRPELCQRLLNYFNVCDFKADFEWGLDIVSDNELWRFTWFKHTLRSWKIWTVFLCENLDDLKLKWLTSDEWSFPFISGPKIFQGETKWWIIKQMKTRYYEWVINKVKVCWE